MEEILRHMFMVDVLVSPTVALALLFGLFSTKFRYALLAGLVFGLISVGFGVLSYDNPQDWDFWFKYRICAFFIDCLLGALVIWACKKLILTIKGKPDRLFFALQKETATGRETATFIGLLCMVLTIVTIGVGIIVG